MKNRSLIRKTLLASGMILFVWGLVMLNVITDIIPIGHPNKALSLSVLIVGIICCVASNFFKEHKSFSNKV
ncbi:hypothetical protein CON64_09840 [Bacillus pseudomycoides]|nr:hypothetical protein CON64_09840 [Bacillus pseudomycoides]